MTWDEFKKAVEDQGVKGDTVITWIDCVLDDGWRPVINGVPGGYGVFIEDKVIEGDPGHDALGAADNGDTP